MCGLNWGAIFTIPWETATSSKTGMVERVTDFRPGYGRAWYGLPGTGFDLLPPLPSGVSQSLKSLHPFFPCGPEIIAALIGNGRGR